MTDAEKALLEAAARLDVPLRGSEESAAFSRARQAVLLERATPEAIDNAKRAYFEMVRAEDRLHQLTKKFPYDLTTKLVKEWREEYDAPKGAGR